MTENAVPNWFDERIEAYLDDSLSASETALFEARLASDPQLEREVTRAGRLTAALSELPALKAPRSLRRSVQDMTGSGFTMPAWGWSLGTACAAALVLMVSLNSVSPVGPGLEAEPSEQQLAQAMADLELALGYVDQVGDLAARQLGTQAGQATARGLVEPARRNKLPATETI